jgi:hypothetical protein
MSALALIEKSITAKTLDQYQERIQRIVAFMKMKNLTTCDINCFTDFLLDMSARLRTHSKSTAEGYRSAVSFHQHTYNLLRLVDHGGDHHCTGKRRPNKQTKVCDHISVGRRGTPGRLRHGTGSIRRKRLGRDRRNQQHGTKSQAPAYKKCSRRRTS